MHNFNHPKVFWAFAGIILITLSFTWWKQAEHNNDMGNQTIEGIDSDHDGVRDDVQRFVTVTYRSSPRTVAAGLQYAKALQSLMLTPALQNDAAETAAINCFWGLYGESSGKIEDAIEAQQLNTKERRSAMIASDSALSGHILSQGDQSNKLSQCTFDPSVLPN